MSLRDDIVLAQQHAMKAGDKEKLSILRIVNSAIKNSEIESKEKLSDDAVQAVIKTTVKQLNDALKDFEKGGREDLTASTKKEIEILSEYLPAQLSDEELKTKIKEILVSAGLEEEKNIGKVMGVVMKELSGKADGSRVRQEISKLTSQD